MTAFVITANGVVPASPECLARWRALPRITPKRWLDDQRRRDTCPPLRAPKITEKGYRKGVKPGNAGRKYDPDPPTDTEVVALMDACDTRRLSGKRQRALIALLRGAGLRIHEALLLLPGDIDFDRNTVLVRRGKGGKRRRSGINTGALLEVGQWIDDRRAAGFRDDQPLFCVVEGPTKGGHLYQAYVRESFRHLARKAGVRRRVACHQFRHALALDMARRGVPIPVISRQLGHSNVATTSTYLQGISDDEVFDTVADLEWAAA